MDIVLIIDSDGKLYDLEPPNPNLNIILERNVNSFNKRLIRVSNCEWCFWGISSDFEVQLYVYHSKYPIQVTETVYEYQRRYPLLHKNEFTDKLLKSDPINLPKESILLPSIDNWKWSNDWTISEQNNESGGWFYSTSFNNKNFTIKKSWYDKVRKRKWTRKRTFTKYESFISIDMPFGCEFANDIKIGGYNISNNIKGYLSVWLLSNSGKLYFRENVSFFNIEGDRWKEIELPEYYRGLSLSCDELGNLWLVTICGKLFTRCNISNIEPSGTCWNQVDTDNHVFEKISSNSKFVYALDMDGNVYLKNEITNKWTKVLKDLCNISVSLSNKLWALSKDKKIIFIGSKLDDIESKLFKWNSIYSKIEIDFLDASCSLDQLDDTTFLFARNIF